MGADLVDSHGDQITSNNGNGVAPWYKIVLANGSELGLGDLIEGGQKNGRSHVKVVPAGQGMVFRYQRFNADDRSNQGWPQGDKGYLRGIQVKNDGSEIAKSLSLSWEPLRLCMYDVDTSYGIEARQLSDNRVALFAHDRHGTLCGLRVNSDGNVIGHESKYALGLDVAFVKVGTIFNGLF